jgi:hypothetical protein
LLGSLTSPLCKSPFSLAVFFSQNILTSMQWYVSTYNMHLLQYL